MNHTMIQKWQAEKAITVKQGCEIFAISRAGYFAAQRRKLKPQPLCPIKVQLKVTLKPLTEAMEVVVYSLT